MSCCFIALKVLGASNIKLYMKNNTIGTIKILAVLMLSGSSLYAQQRKMQLFKLSDVRLLESPF